MENVRICILNSLDSPVAFMDNRVPNSLHYWDEKLHIYLKGSASTFDFSCDVTHPDSINIVVGGRIAFIYDNKQYYFTIISTNQTETELTVSCYATALGLINTYVGYLAESGLHTIQWYIEKFDEFGFIEVGTNEIMSKQLELSYTSDSTLLSRLFDLADEFEAEMDFVPVLNNDYSLKNIQINIYRSHDQDTGAQGIGSKRTDKIIRYNRDVDGITKNCDISELYTAIKPTGSDDTINLFKMSEKVVYNDDGEILYRKPNQDNYIYAVQAKDRFPSSILAHGNERYISNTWSYTTTNTDRLYEKALAQLKKFSAPKLEYTVDGYFECNIGDTFRIQDEEFNPKLTLEARVTEIEISFTNPSSNSIVLDNFKENKAEIGSNILAKIQELSESAKDTAISAATEVVNVAVEAAQTEIEDLVVEQITVYSEQVTEIANEAKETAESAQTTANEATSVAEDAATIANETHNDIYDDQNGIQNQIDQLSVENYNLRSQNAELQSSLATVEAELSSLTVLYNNVQNWQNTINSALSGISANLDRYSNYITINEEDGTIQIQSIDPNDKTIAYQMTLKSSYLAFDSMEQSQSFFSTGLIKVPDISVSTRFAIGDYEFKVKSNGNLILV